LADAGKRFHFALINVEAVLLFQHATTTKQFRRTILHGSFRIGVAFKGLDGLVEFVGGFFFVFFSSDALADFVDRHTRGVLQLDPDNLLAHSLRHSFEHMSSDSKIFVAIYLLGHGAVKLLMVAGLLREKRWVFPVGIVVLFGFISFQIYRLCGHFSISLISFTLLDIIIAVLVCVEYRSLGKNTSHGRS
jgi:uncharacterized membrane protein